MSHSPHPDQQQIGSLGALVVTVAFMVCLWASVGIFSLLSRWTIDALVSRVSAGL